MTLRPLFFAPFLALYAQQEPPPAVGTQPAQPVPFSHRVHAAAALRCAECHKTAATATAAGMPAERLCMNCHVTIKKDSPAVTTIARHAADGKPIDWTRLYRLPDYVSFSHRRHLRATGIECANCHGDVAQQDTLAKAKSIGMASCQSCHDRHKARNGCDTCHSTHPG